MNIRYRGIAPDNPRRLAEIQYSSSEQDAVERFLLLLDETVWKYYSEDEVVTIEVDDRDEYDEVKAFYKAYKNFNYDDYIRRHRLGSAALQWTAGYLTDEGLYDQCKEDLDLYIILVSRGYEERQIKDLMYEVSCANDAYANAVSSFGLEITKKEESHEKCNYTAGCQQNRRR